MALTTASRFSSVRLRREGINNTQQVYFNAGVDGSRYIDVTLGDLAADHADRTDLDTLQSIYASTDGFLDADGNALEPTLYGYFVDGASVLDVADLEAYGIWNPLVAGSYERWQAARKTVGAFLLEEAEVTKDATSGRTDVNMPGGMLGKRRVPSTGTMTLDLRDWALVPDPTNPETMGWMVYEAPTGADWAGTVNVGGLAPVRALVKWLASIRESGDTVDLNPTSLADLAEALGATTFRFTSNGLYFDFVIDSHRILANQTTLELRIAQTSGSSADLDMREFLSTMMNAGAQTIEVSRAAEYPPANLPDGPLYGSSLRFDDNLIFRHRNRYPTILGKDHANDWYETPVGYGRVVALEDLSTFNNKQRLGAFYAVGAIHMNETYTADETLILPNPSTFLQYWATEWVLTLHNQNETYNFTIEDADEVNIATLLPGEIIHLRFSRDARGHGEITNASEFNRVLRYSHTPASADIVVTTQPYMVYDSDYNIRLIPLGETPLKVHTEVFDVGGTDVFSEGDDFDSFADYHFDDTVEIWRQGPMRIDGAVGVRTLGGSGSINTGHGLALLRQRSNATPVVLAWQRQSRMGSYENETWSVFVEPSDSEIEDVFMLGFLYPNGTTFNMDNMKFSNIRLEMTLENAIRVTE